MIGFTGFRDPLALSSALASLEMLQPMAIGSLNPVEPSVSVSNFNIVHCYCMDVVQLKVKLDWPGLIVP